MLQTVLDYIDLICPLLCFLFCVIHVIIQWIVSIKQNKKINRICEKCFAPVVDGEQHVCSLTDKQLELLAIFVSSLKGDKNVD